MNWTRFSAKVYKTSGAADSKCGSSFCYTRKPHQNATLDDSIRTLCGFQSQRGTLPATPWPQEGLDGANAAPSFQDFEQRLIVARNVIRRRFKGNSMSSNNIPVSLYRQFGHQAGNGDDPELNRDFLVQLWVADRKMEHLKRKRRGVKYSKQTPYHYTAYGSFNDAGSFAQDKPTPAQPPPSQSISGFLKPESPEEVNFWPPFLFSTLTT